MRSATRAQTVAMRQTGRRPRALRGHTRVCTQIHSGGDVSSDRVMFGCIYEFGAGAALCDTCRPVVEGDGCARAISQTNARRVRARASSTTRIDLRRTTGLRGYPKLGRGGTRWSLTASVNLHGRCGRRGERRSNELRRVRHQMDRKAILLLSTLSVEHRAHAIDFNALYAVVRAGRCDGRRSDSHDGHNGCGSSGCGFAAIFLRSARAM